MAPAPRAARWRAPACRSWARTQADRGEHEQHEHDLVAAARRHRDVGEPGRERRHPDRRHTGTIAAESPPEGGHEQEHGGAGDERRGDHGPRAGRPAAVEPPEHGGVQRREVELRVPFAAEAVARPEALARAQVGAGVVGDDVVAHGQRDSDRPGRPAPPGRPARGIPTASRRRRRSRSRPPRPRNVARRAGRSERKEAGPRRTWETSSPWAQALRWPPIRTSGARRRATSTTAALPMPSTARPPARRSPYRSGCAARAR